MASTHSSDKKLSVSEETRAIARERHALAMAERLKQSKPSQPAIRMNGPLATAGPQLHEWKVGPARPQPAPKIPIIPGVPFNPSEHRRHIRPNPLAPIMFKLPVNVEALPRRYRRAPPRGIRLALEDAKPTHRTSQEAIYAMQDGIGQGIFFYKQALMDELEFEGTLFGLKVEMPANCDRYQLRQDVEDRASAWFDKIHASFAAEMFTIKLRGERQMAAEDARLEQKRLSFYDRIGKDRAKTFDDMMRDAKAARENGGILPADCTDRADRAAKGVDDEWQLV
ncbi:hypothetical protein F5Y04DRAFT_276610 [Hypomontagnella monticulosa]|nr:hypothetical protein F5Y04DRAFT_276610 [Hypomontagnella monticulosa]